MDPRGRTGIPIGCSGVSCICDNLMIECSYLTLTWQCCLGECRKELPQTSTLFSLCVISMHTRVTVEEMRSDLDQDFPKVKERETAVNSGWSHCLPQYAFQEQLTLSRKGLSRSSNHSQRTQLCYATHHIPLYLRYFRKPSWGAISSWWLPKAEDSFLWGKGHW